MKKLDLPALGLLMGLAAYPTKAEATPIKAPVLIEGKNVYTIPENFVPPKIELEGIKEIEKAVDKFRYDYYVVLVEKVEMRESNADIIMDQTIDGIAADWKRDYPKQFESTDSLFVLAYEPKKFRFLAGKKWREEGFKRSAYDDFNSLFSKGVKNGSPTKGIIDMGMAVDKFLVTKADSAREAEKAETRAKIWTEKIMKAEREASERAEAEALLDRTDPVRIAARAEKARNEAIQRDKAQKDALLVKEKLDKKIQAEKLAHAQEEKIRLEKEKAEKIEQEKHEAAKKAILLKRIKFVSLFLLGLAAIGLPAAWVIRRRKQHEQLAQTFNEQWNIFDRKVKNAVDNFLAFDNDRDEIDLFSNLLSGKTLDLFNAVTAEVDEINNGIQAMQQHLANCQQVAKKASWQDPQPLKEAQKLLSSGIDFSIGKGNPNKLFKPTEETIHFNPEEFFSTFEERYAKAMEGWGRLKAAMLLQKGIDVRATFTEDNYNAMRRDLEKNGISEAWVTSHPLAGDGASDTHLYNQLDHLRDTDPLAYQERLEAYKEEERKMQTRVEELLVLLNQINTSQGQKILAHPSVVPDHKNPQMTEVTAQQKAEYFKSLLATSNDLAAIKQAYDEASELFSRAVAQAQHIKSSVERSPVLFAEVKALQTEINTFHKNALSSIASLTPLYNQNDLPSPVAADELKAQATAELELANELLSQLKHGEANQKVESAKGIFESARQSYQRLIRQCEALNQSVLDAKNVIGRADKLSRSISGTKTLANRELEQAAMKHRGLSLPSVQFADRLQKEAIGKLATAQSELAQKQYLEVGKLAEQAVADFERSQEEYQATVSRCSELDRLKSRLSQIKANLSQLRQEAKNQIDRYNGIQTLQAYSEGMINHLTSYEEAIRVLEALSSSWSEAARRARADYEAEMERQRRIREEQERQEREAREAEQRRVREAEARRQEEERRIARERRERQEAAEEEVRREERRRRRQQEEAAEAAAELARGLASLVGTISNRSSSSSSDSRGGDWDSDDDKGSDAKGGDW